eukprot:3084911-Prymnesium_polylepis.1
MALSSDTPRPPLALAVGLLDLRHLVHVCVHVLLGLRHLAHVHVYAAARGGAAVARGGSAVARGGGGCDIRTRRPRPALTRDESAADGARGGHVDRATCGRLCGSRPPRGQSRLACRQRPPPPPCACPHAVFTDRQLRRPSAAAPATGVIPDGRRRRLHPALGRLVLVGHARLVLVVVVVVV